MPDSIRALLDTHKFDYKSLEQRITAEQAALDAVQEELVVLGDAHEILQGLAASVQQLAHAKLADVVTQCLQAVFDDPYEFRIEFERKRNRTEAKLVFVRDGMVLDPMTAAGGGVVDVAAFVLRLNTLALAKPPVRKVLVLDEAFKHLSANYADRMVAVLESLCAQLGFQIIQVTHNDKFMVGKVLRLSAGGDLVLVKE